MYEKLMTRGKNTKLFEKNLKFIRSSTEFLLLLMKFIISYQLHYLFIYTFRMKSLKWLKQSWHSSCTMIRFSASGFLSWLTNEQTLQCIYINVLVFYSNFMTFHFVCFMFRLFVVISSFSFLVCRNKTWSHAKSVEGKEFLCQLTYFTFSKTYIKIATMRSL